MEKLKNIPSLRFPEFNENWELKTLGEVGEIVTGLTYSPKDISSDGVLVLRSSNVKDRLIKLKDNVFVKTTNFNKVINNDILICVRNGSKNLIGKNALITKNQEGLAFGAFMIIYRSKLNSFIFQLFDTQKYYKIIKENLGATINSINNSDLRKFEFLFPSLQEQTKIASFLTAVDDKLQALKQKKTLLEQYKKGVMQKIFSQELRFKDDNGNDYPDWEEKKLVEICDIKKGKQLNKEELTDSGEYPCINGGINISGFTDKFNTLENTITISEGGNSCGYINFFDVKFWSGGHNYSVEINNIEEINNIFLFQILKFNEVEIMKLRVGSGLPNIQKKDLAAFLLFIPKSINEQTKIANFLFAIDDKINHCHGQIEKTEVWKKGLLQQMFC
jgi:type I restriction enzyme S subunit